MPPRRAARPSVCSLEGRLLLSRPGASPPRGPAAAVTPLAFPSGNPALEPKIGNGYYTAKDGSDDGWLRLHNSYNQRAAAASDNVVFLGDSIVYFLGDETDRVPASPIWNDRIAKYRAANFGIPGDSTRNLLWRIPNGELAGRPRLVVVQIGTNDLIDGIEPETVAAGVSAVARAIHRASPRSKVLVLSVPPVHEGLSLFYYETGNPLGARIIQTNALIAREQRSAAFTFADPWRGLRNPDGTFADPALSDDGIHPSPLGYQRMVDALQNPLNKLLGYGPRGPRVSRGA